MNWILGITLVLIVAKCATEIWLEWLNQRQVRAHAGKPPPGLEEVMDRPTYARAVEYTLAKSKFQQLETLYEAGLLLVLLLSGILPRAFEWSKAEFGVSVWAMGGFLFLAGLALSLTHLPFDWYHQFRLEARFGFNTTSFGLWSWDRVKGFLLTLLLGYPLLALILRLVDWTGAHWWIWAWGSVLGFQVLMMVLAPVLLLPLFNKFTPLPEGSLKDRLFALADRTRFRAQSIQVMDGSRRSKHANAFFTGFGRFRKVVLFDTLLQQLRENELEAVLAHEIGHYKLKHIPKLVVWSAVSMLAGFFVISRLALSAPFHQAFGFAAAGIVPALLLFSLLGGVAGFWLSPLVKYWSRRFEYQADAFAGVTMGETGSLIAALRKLSEKNLGNLTPHPLYSRFYYSHPALAEREERLRVKSNQ